MYKENKDKKLDPIQLEKELVELFTKEVGKLVDSIPEEF